MHERAPKAAELPDDHGIKSPPPRVCHQMIESGTRSLRAAHLVLVDLRQRPPPTVFANSISDAGSGQGLHNSIASSWAAPFTYSALMYLPALRYSAGSLSMRFGGPKGHGYTLWAHQSHLQWIFRENSRSTS
jgi:hypothetical protein